MRFIGKPALPDTVIFVILTIIALTGCNDNTQPVEKTNYPSAAKIALPESFQIGSRLTISGGKGWLTVLFSPNLGIFPG